MKFYIIFLILINTLLAINPPPLPVKTKNYVSVEIPPPLPMKRHSYFITDNNKVLKAQSKVRHSVVTYYVRGKQLFECDDKLFYNYKDASNYCQIANEFEAHKVGKSNWDLRSPLLRRKSLSRSNSDLTDKRNSNSRLSYVSMDGKNSFLEDRRNSNSRHSYVSMHGRNSLSGSRNSLSGINRSSSLKSLSEQKNLSKQRRNGVSWSNEDLSSIRNSISGSNSNLSPRRDSVFGSIDDLQRRRNSLTGSINDLSRRKNSLSRSRESLNAGAIANEINKEYLSKKTKKKPGSHEIWLKVWKDCSFKCYSANYFDVYKNKALLELNLYRIKHKANILQMNSRLAYLAQDLAEEYLVRRKLDIKKYYIYGILYNKVKVTLATTVLKTWYESKAKYNFLLNKPSSDAALSFAQLVWRSTAQIGIGVQLDDDEIIFVYVFYPKGNINGEYRKNVHKWIS
uniref:CAP domain-containing protein (inferred by orthology to a zebrafish protein) n=1 Tax=Strongyloides venezuelensis TaxID=75913 RepID=A0A0K0FD08_STRVS